MYKNEFHLPMEKVPTVTAQQKGVRVVCGKPQFYEKKELKQTRQFFSTLLKEHAPAEPIDGPVMLSVSWFFGSKSHKGGEWRTTRPDTDNLQKLFKDCMTDAGYWHDDSQVAYEKVKKIWGGECAGITVRIQEMEKVTNEFLYDEWLYNERMHNDANTMW